MAGRLLDKIENMGDESLTVQKTSVRKTAVEKITSESGKDKQISAKVNGKMYKQFTMINDAQGLSNNSALNMLISKYVRENKALLEEEI